LLVQQGGRGGLMERIRVLLVDDHDMFSESLERGLNASGDIEVVGIVPRVAEALEVAPQLLPDVVLLDYQLPDGDGIDAARQLLAVLPKTRIVMLTGSADDRILLRALQAGCCGYVTKDKKLAELVLAVRAAKSGNAVISPELLSRLMRGTTGQGTLGADLTERELELLQLVAEGYSNRAIADHLSLSVHTVRNHVHSIITKLQSHSKLEAVATALREGILRPPLLTTEIDDSDE
jgi:DNA-binding NarL/FixJ family response regulator